MLVAEPELEPVSVPCCTVAVAKQPQVARVTLLGANGVQQMYDAVLVS